MKDSSMMIKEAYSKPMNLFDDDIAPKILLFILETIKKYGKNSFVWMGPNPQVLIMEPELIKEVLSKNCLYQKARGNPFLALLGQGLVSYEEDKWAKHRKIVNPAFHLEKLKPIHGSFLNRELTPALEVVLAVVLREDTRLGTQAAMELSSSSKSFTNCSPGLPDKCHYIMYSFPAGHDLEKLIRDSIAATLPKAISSALSVSSSGTSSSINSTWHLDSGASNHMTGNLSQFSSLSSGVSKHFIHTANGHTLSSSGIGSIGNLSNVLYVPNLKANLVSVGQLVDQNCVVKFSPNGCVVQNLKTGMTMATGHRFGRIFLLESVHRHLHHCFLSGGCYSFE
ncbi:hypothetical protein FXO38_15678 [Capsicum annuum]|nr:hypothetical protein FXO38_15678 [Capsicum annuum]KAF3679734.1 hypothetical protein FXO37_03688 [Capsicum annuum]